jgi:hypothetical protein
MALRRGSPRRREQRPHLSRRGNLPFVVLIVVMTLAFLGGGAFILFVQQTGTKTQATVTTCDVKRIRHTTIHCIGTWTVDGSVKTGTIDGANPDDEGNTIDVRLNGGRAYTTSLRLPIILIVIGLLFAAGGAWELRKRLPEPPA